VTHVPTRIQGRDLMKATDKKYSLGTFLSMSLFIILLFPAIFILISGNRSWVEGWILAIWFDGMMLANLVYMYIKNPGLISERLKTPASSNQKKWDRYLLSILFIIAAIWFIGLPLDAQRFQWSSAFPLLVKVLGGGFLIPAFYFMLRATMDNPYLSTVVRIQSDRRQRVVSTGAYGLVRHPQYLGIILTVLGGTLLAGSLIGLVTAILISLLLVWRIIGEEKMLVEELEGYQEYQKKVTCRLIPYIW
jgi:protein-S-isoprenylcysteine O-methyltransferase Ste14